MIGAPFRSCGQKNLADDGKRIWDDEIRSRLDKEYYDWKDPKQTYMVPPSFIGNDADKGKKAEEKVYNLLHELGQENNEPMFVVHSFDFSEHIPNCGRERSWVMGESDFVVIHKRHGPVFFQVKATETGKNYKEAEKQVHKDKLAIENFFQKMVKENISTRKATEAFKNCPGFVVMPNCPRGQSVCIRDNAIYQEDCSSLEAFSRWWLEKIKRAKHPPLDQTVFEYMVMRFVGWAHTGHCFGYSIDESHRVLVCKTREQLKVLLNSTAEQWITGPAGSGKTCLLMEKVETLAKKALLRNTGERILVVCYNKPLSKMFSTTFSQYLNDLLQNVSEDLSSVVKVATFDELLYEMTEMMSGDTDGERETQVARAVELLQRGTVSIEQYDHIFVDECQDLCGAEWPILFAKLQKNTDDQLCGEDDDAFLEPKYIWYLYDTNQHLRLSHQQAQFLKKANKKTTKLSVVLRNTGNVFHQSRKYFKSKVTGNLELGHDEFGLPIKWDDSLPATKVTEREGAAAIWKHIENLRQNKVKDRDICVLVRNKDISNKLKAELKLLKVETQDAEERFETVQAKIIVESIWRFKGLESKVVILYNPPFFEGKDWTVKRTNELLYTAVSRCFCYLVVVTTKRGCKALQSPKGIHEDTSSAGSHKNLDMDCSSEYLVSARRSQDSAWHKEPFGKGSIDSQYESGPPEPSTTTKRRLGDDSDDDGKDEAHISPPKISRMEAAAMQRQYEMRKRSNEERPQNAHGCNLLEPGDPYIKDSIRNNVFSLLNEAVQQNLEHIPGPSNQASNADVTSVVAQIEYEVYCSRRREHNQRKYTKELRTLKGEIDTCNRRQESHESVKRALTRSMEST